MDAVNLSLSLSPNPSQCSDGMREKEKEENGDMPCQRWKFILAECGPPLALSHEDMSSH